MNQDRYRPDFESNLEMPSWLDFGEEQSAPSVSPFVDALKKRMRRPQSPMGSAGSAMGGAIGGDMMGTMGKASGGGPKSL